MCLNYGRDNPQLLVTGGWDDDMNILSDAWILDIESGRWREVRGINNYHNGYSIMISIWCVLVFYIIIVS